MTAVPQAEQDERRAAPTNLRFDLFDSLRAIAALSVLVFHVAGWSGVSLQTWYGAFTSKLGHGVTLFFLISGFLLYRPHAVAVLGGPRAPSTGDYALRRAFRILPAYWVALTLLALWPGLKGVFTANWWVFYGLLQSNRLDWSMQGIGVAWSLSVEAGFYLLLPLVAVVLARAGRSLRPHGRLKLQLLGLAALGVGSVMFRATLHRSGDLGLASSLPSNLFGFVAGMALAVLSAWFQGREREWWAARFVADHPGLCWALALASFCAVSLSPAFPRPFSGKPQSTLAFAAEAPILSWVALLVMLPAVFGERAGGLPRQVMRTRPLLWVGKISYGVFLWHLPLVEALQRRAFAGFPPLLAFLGLAAVIVPAALALGWLSWRLVEAPSLRLARALGGRGTFARVDPEPLAPRQRESA